MKSGCLGMIVCPMNDDQLIHSISTDPEVSRIVVLRNEYSERICEKLDSHGLKYDVVEEQDYLASGIAPDRSGFTVLIRINDLGLHADPKALKARIEEQIVEMQPVVDAIGLYYGICGNWGWDVTSWAEASEYKPVEVFKGDDGKVCDDCIAVVVGSSSKYLELERTHTGMFYLTPSIADNWLRFLAAGDMGKQLESIPKDVLAEFGITDEISYMRWMFEIGDYKNRLKLYTGWSDKEWFDKRAEEIGEALNLKPIEAGPDWVTADAADALYKRCKDHLSDSSSYVRD